VGGWGGEGLQTSPSLKTWALKSLPFIWLATSHPPFIQRATCVFTFQQPWQEQQYIWATIYYMCIYICAYVHVHIHICTYTYIYATAAHPPYIQRATCVFTCQQLRQKHQNIYIYIYIYMYIYTYTYIYIYTVASATAADVWTRRLYAVYRAGGLLSHIYLYIQQQPTRPLSNLRVQRTSAAVVEATADKLANPHIHPHTHSHTLSFSYTHNHAYPSFTARHTHSYTHTLSLQHTNVDTHIHIPDTHPESETQKYSQMDQRKWYFRVHGLTFSVNAMLSRQIHRSTQVVPQSVWSHI